RDAVFAKVTQRAIRRIALQVFEHLHRLSLRFHLERQTGGMSRDIERGTKGIGFLLNFTLFNILPTLVEIGLVAGILLVNYHWSFAVVTFLTIASYIGFTLGVTEWRMVFRRSMNELDSQANSKAIDALLNYETVKYFGNERYEVARYDGNLASWERSAVRNQTSLNFLNAGQGVIIAVGVTVLVGLAGRVIDRILKFVDALGALIEKRTVSAIVRDVKSGRIYNKPAMRKLGAPIQEAITKTEAFRKWFGNSRVVDEDGEPLVVYHTGAFDDSKIISASDVQKEKGNYDPDRFNHGIYFTADAEYSGTYGESLSGKPLEGASMFPVYLSIQNPLIIDNNEDL
ncbi:MAG TPA: ABC transporter transmembrane domain-containing protein, partial [Anaerolineaceae bacterium]|nr:ABC transporter transmembrane domain-containing protein [Anaerolineaceae bacterium]